MSAPENAPRRASPLVWAWAGVGAAALVVAAAWSRLDTGPADEGIVVEVGSPAAAPFEMPRPGLLPGPVGPMPDVAAVERSGRALRTNELRGRWTVMNLIFTHCGGPCPRLTAQMKRLQDALGDGDDLRLVSFTVDPDRDTPEVLAKYAKDFDADPERWWFVRTSAEDLRTIVGKSFRLMPEEDLFVHSNHLIVLDPQLRMRALYLPLQEEDWLPRLLADVAALRKGS